MVVGASVWELQLRRAVCAYEVSWKLTQTEQIDILWSLWIFVVYL